MRKNCREILFEDGRDGLLQDGSFPKEQRQIAFAHSNKNEPAQEMDNYDRHNAGENGSFISFQNGREQYFSLGQPDVLSGVNLQQQVQEDDFNRGCKVIKYSTEKQMQQEKQVTGRSHVQALIQGRNVNTKLKEKYSHFFETESDSKDTKEGQNDPIIREESGVKDQTHLQSRLLKERKDNQAINLNELFLDKVEAIQNELNSIDPYKISLYSLDSLEDVRRENIKKDQCDQLGIPILGNHSKRLGESDNKRNQSCQVERKQVDYEGSSDIQRRGYNQRFVKSNHQKSMEDINKYSQQDGRISQNGNKPFRMNSSYGYREETEHHPQEEEEDFNLKKQPLKYEVYASKESINKFQHPRDTNSQGHMNMSDNYRKRTCSFGGREMRVDRHYIRDSFENQRMKFYDSFMPKKMKMMQSPYYMLKYKMSGKTKFNIDSCISELASLNSCLSEVISR